MNWDSCFLCDAEESKFKLSSSVWELEWGGINSYFKDPWMKPSLDPGVVCGFVVCFFPNKTSPCCFVSGQMMERKWIFHCFSEEGITGRPKLFIELWIFQSLLRQISSWNLYQQQPLLRFYLNPSQYKTHPSPISISQDISKCTKCGWNYLKWKIPPSKKNVMGKVPL